MSTEKVGDDDATKAAEEGEPPIQAVEENIPEEVKTENQDVTSMHSEIKVELEGNGELVQEVPEVLSEIVESMSITEPQSELITVTDSEPLKGAETDSQLEAGTLDVPTSNEETVAEMEAETLDATSGVEVKETPIEQEPETLDVDLGIEVIKATEIEVETSGIPTEVIEAVIEQEPETKDVPTDVEVGISAEPPSQEELGELTVEGETRKSQVSLKSLTSRAIADHKSDESEILTEDLDMSQAPEDNRGSMLTQAGSINSSSSSSQVTSIEETLPKDFQDYVKQYSNLFSKISDKEDVPCDEEGGKTFLKIDLNEIISGYKTETKLCKDSKTSLSGMVRVRQSLVCIENESIVLRRDYENFKGVRILSGGHMGNEPLYIDYVGKGLLTAAVLGTVSDPPSVASVTKAMRELSKKSPGVLIIIQNNVEYRIIFGLAMERIRMEGFTDIEMVTIGDDCFERCKSPVGRRGLPGIILLYKIAGSMAECLKTLREIYVATREASKSIVTISCTTKPFKAIGTGLDKNSKDGIPFNGDSVQMIKKMIDYCIHPMKYFSLRYEPEDKFVVLINSYKTKTPEFYVSVNCIMKELEKKMKCARVYADNFVTGFWSGFSITLLLVCNSKIVQFMDASCNCSYWPRIPSEGFLTTTLLDSQETNTFTLMGPALSRVETRVVKHAVLTACKAVVFCENMLNTMHFFGNYGTKLRVGAESILEAARQKSLNFNRPFNLLIEISEILLETLPGVMGSTYGCLLEGAARSLLRNPLTAIGAEDWSKAMDEALKSLRAYTNAKGGMVSLANTLIPVVSAIPGPITRLPQKPNGYSLEQTVADHTHKGSIRTLTARGNLLATGGFDEVIHVYNLDENIEVGTLTQHTGTVTCLTFTSDEKHLISCSEDGSIAIYRIGSWIMEKLWPKAHKGTYVNWLAVHPSNKMAFSVGNDGNLKTWNLIEGKSAFVTNISHLTKRPELVVWSLDGELYAIPHENEVSVFEVKSAKVKHKFKLQNKITSTHFIQNDRLCVGDMCGNLVVFDLDKDEVMCEQQLGDVRIKAISSHEEFVIVATSTGTVSVYELTEEELRHVAKCDSSCRITCLTISCQCHRRERKQKKNNVEVNGTVKTEISKEVKQKIAKKKSVKIAQTKTDKKSTPKKRKLEHSPRQAWIVEEIDT